MSRYAYDSQTEQSTLIASGNLDKPDYHGTKAYWDTLTDAQKAEYGACEFTDVFDSHPIDSTPTQNSGNPVSSGAI